MICGVVFDLGSVLIRFAGNRGQARQEAYARLVRALVEAGSLADPGSFLPRFERRMAEYERQRSTDFLEYSTEWVLGETFREIGLPVPASTVLRRSLRSMYEVYEACWQPVEGAREVVDRLRAEGIRLGLLSNAADPENARRLIQNAGYEGCFDPVVISSVIGIRKPNPQAFRIFLEQWRLAPAQTAMVGDQLGADILGAQFAGMHNIWYAVDPQDPPNLAHAETVTPEVTIQRLEQVLEVIHRM
ncbi:MAG: HAD family hydrolase [Anaerolineales bacterium]|jgi:putative hydrolase of the HAD superfamily